MKRVTENAMFNCTLGFRVYCDCYNAKKNRPTVQFRLGVHVCCFSYHLSAVPLSPVRLSDSSNDAKTSQLKLRRA